ncbi:MAG: D-aminoacyl-tRNA deacylase [Candidatus Kariarchaeaceae archaeon]|jgi:D-aminoacyl-tRNA deacylase
MSHNDTETIKSKVLIVVSNQDVAGLNMKARLITNIEFVEEIEFKVPFEWPKGEYKYFVSRYCSLLEIPNNQIKTDYFQNTIESDLLIYASKHSSAMGKKALLVHTTGIWGEESGHGGNDHEIALAPSLALTVAFDKIKELKEERNLTDFWIGAEVTHHGPSSLNIPIMFIETGGTEDEWNDIDACNIIADVILEIIKIYNLPKDEQKGLETKQAMIGIGGGHYAPSFIKKLSNGEFLMGHIIPKYAHEHINEDMLKLAWERTLAEEKIFLIDKKGTKSNYRHHFIEIIESLGYPWKYT